MRVPVATRHLLTAIGLGVLATGISAFRSGTPSFWADEFASVLAARRSLPQLFDLFGHVDIVHGVYYLLLRVWTDVFGIGEFAVRFPSALAIGAAAAGLWLLVARLSRPGIATLATLIFAILPRVTLIGTEGRGFALALALLVWAILLLVVLLERPTVRRRDWVWWSVLVSAGIAVFMYTLLVWIAVFAWVWWVHREKLGTLVRFGALAVAIASPVVIGGILQAGQIGWVDNAGISFDTVFVTLWFGSPLLAGAAWALMLCAGTLIPAALRSRGGGAERALLLLATGWALGPPLLLLLVSIVYPTFVPRYLALGTPAVAILIALGISTAIRFVLRPFIGTAGSAAARTRVPTVILGSLAVLLVGVLALPGYLDQRAPLAKGSDARQVAEYIGAHARPGESVVFDLERNPGASPRRGLSVYPEHYAGLRTPGVVHTYLERGGFNDEVLPVADTVIDPESRVLWLVVTQPQRERRAQQNIAALAAQGFSPAGEHILGRSVVVELRR